MQFLLLWSGDKRGMRKARIDAIENTVGTVGHWRGGKVYLPCPVQLREALPYRYRAAFDRDANWGGLPQVWEDATNNDAPLTIRLLSSRLKPLLTIYLQPLKDS